MKDGIPICISLRLPKANNPNKREHWAGKMKKVSVERSLAEMEARSVISGTAISGQIRGNKAPKWKKARIHCTWTAKHEKFIPDEGNAHARLKAFIDGFQDAGIFIDDKYVTTTIDRVVGPKAGVEFVISEA